MDFEQPETVKILADRVRRFMREEVYPAEEAYYEQDRTAANRWTWQPILRELRARAAVTGRSSNGWEMASSRRWFARPFVL